MIDKMTETVTIAFLAQTGSELVNLKVKGW
jgi:hypothetical protein